MNAKEIYTQETGIEIPSNQMAYYEWHSDYIKWLEQNIENNNNLFVHKVENLLNEYKIKHLPNAEKPYHHESEAWSTIKMFMQWLKNKN